MIQTNSLWAGEALKRFITELFESKYQPMILDVGSGDGHHAKAMRDVAAFNVTTISRVSPADFVGDYFDFELSPDFGGYDAIWASHVLEHVLNVHSFLRKIYSDLRMGGLLAITVPPAKHNLVGGHVNLFNQGTLLYNLILAGFDCSRARVSPTYTSGPVSYPYNISVIVRKQAAELPNDLTYDCGDIEKLARFFPVKVYHDIDGSEIEVNW